MMPALQLGVRPGWHRQNHAVRRPIARPAAERRRDDVMHHPPIESVPGDRDTIVAENLVATALPSAGWPESEDREVAGAPAEVSDQDNLVVPDSARVVIGGGDRFVLENDLVPPRTPDRNVQARLGEPFVVWGARIRKMHRPSDYHARRQRSELRFRGVAQIDENRSDQIAQ